MNRDLPHLVPPTNKQEQSSGGSIGSTVFDLSSGEITGQQLPVMRAVYRLVYGISKLPRFRKTTVMSYTMQYQQRTPTAVSVNSSALKIGIESMDKWTMNPLDTLPSLMAKREHYLLVA